MLAPTVTMDKINRKDCQVLLKPLVIQGFGFSSFLGLFQVMKWQTPDDHRDGFRLTPRMLAGSSPPPVG